jgi:hypothetical protein
METVDGETIYVNYKFGRLDYSDVSPYLLRAIGTPHFMRLLGGTARTGNNSYCLYTIAAHLEHNYQLVPDIVGRLKNAGKLSLLQPPEMQEELLKILNSTETVTVPFGCNGHYMLLNLSFTDTGLRIDVYNSGLGLEFHAQDPKNPKKFKTCKTYFFNKMKKDSPRFLTLLGQIAQSAYLQPIAESYKIFRFGKVLHDNGSEFQTSQKSENCSLECVMAFLKKEMGPAEYKRYRIQLIQDTLAQFSKNQESGM